LKSVRISASSRLADRKIQPNPAFRHGSIKAKKFDGFLPVKFFG
jgi:hypothetical protein